MVVRSFFSISYSLLTPGNSLGFELFVNSSSIKGKQKFIRIFNSDDSLDDSDLDRLKENYPQVYVPEDQREDYFKSLIKRSGVDAVQATTIIKDSAIKYLHDLFEPEKEFSNELLTETIQKSKVAVESMIDVLDDYDIDSLRGLIGDLSAHDFYTYDHSINVSMYCIMLVKAIKPNASKLELTHAGLGGLLHDLGKVKISTDILNSPEGLTDEQYAEIKKHPDYGMDLLLQNQDGDLLGLDLETIGRVVHEHHENVDGTGYPQGLKGKDIHLLARVCAIVDFFDAITTKRSYSDVMPLSKALKVMENTCDKKIDRKLFTFFANKLNHSPTKDGKSYIMQENFDPSIPFAKFPVEEIDSLFTTSDFGKIKMLEEKTKKTKKRK